ncbi:LysM peptidoglycan-binding domain-containing protein [Veronia pacifica]|uniref:LysM domain-containing protein n=1 Tax=Veronia pacifica TaxID=1080227 RepID=A0A1C3EFH7_9GAMM|nr:LysM domain-containing protein [Veronia pacifica]ODA31988.1 hypothetical protein A8L45_14285 [Veronia pacifica]
MLKILITAGIAAMFTYQASASVIVSDSAPKTYVVKKGDTLWGISAIYLDKPWKWPELWKVNPSIANPHLIYPGDVLSLVWQDGSPRLIKTSTSNSDSPLQALSKVLLSPYTRTDTLIPTSDLMLAPKVISSTEGRLLITGRDQAYVDTELSMPEWEVYRPVSGFNRELGKHTASVTSLRHIASASVVAADSGRAKILFTRVHQEVRPNDILLPKLSGQDIQPFYPKPAAEGIEGKMIGHLYGQRYAGMRDVVVVDRGDVDGLSAGDTLTISEPGAVVRSQKNLAKPGEPSTTVTLPSQHIGTLMVIRTYSQFSLAILMAADKPVAADSVISSPAL